MTMLTWINENWVNLIILISFAVVMVWEILSFVKLPKAERIKNIKEWLLYAVIEAEKELGEKTGALKLRLVYDRAVEKFEWIATVVTFEVFSEWVDEALDRMKNMLNSNKVVANYVEGNIENN